MNKLKVKYKKTKKTVLKWKFRSQTCYFYTLL